MRILLFGAGSGLNDFLSIVPKDIEIIGLSDNNPEKHGRTILGHKVHAPELIPRMDFDYVIVTSRAGEAVRAQLVDLGIERERVLLFYPGFNREIRTLLNKDITVLNEKLGLGLHPLSVCNMPVWPNGILEIMPSEDDYCRLMSIRLAAERISQKAVPGAIAELGVYRGELAAALNWLFPDRILYLFDTFEGFSENDLLDGEEKKHSQAAVGDFQDTNLESVLSRMPHRQMVRMRKGYFPATSEGLEDNFALVSLDVDLYKPTVAGLNYFYPRLNKGGCMFVHDYNNRRYMGVRSAVEEFVEENGVPLVQLPDFGGTAILPK